MPDAEAQVEAILAKRTFWEKVTILHAEFHRPQERALHGRCSRHYYDVAMMAEGQIKTEALADVDLLAQVVSHKKTFYPAGWARYDLAHIGSLRVSPAESRVPALRRDYRDMASVAPSQNRYFRANWRLRMLVRVPVRMPKVPLLRLVSGLPQLGWLGKLKASKRNWRRWPSA